jgi:IS4 transposase
MIHTQPKQNVPEPEEGKPVSSAEEWLGRNASGRQRLWERLNPRHRKMLRMLGRALVLRQRKGHVPETAWEKLAAALDELERLARRIEQLLAALASRTPPAGE